MFIAQFILPENANAIQMLTSHMHSQRIIRRGLSCAQLSYEYRCENRVVASNSHHIRIHRKYESGFIQSNGPVTRAPVTGTKNDNDKNARPLWLNERILHGAFIGACVTGP